MDVTSTTHEKLILLDMENYVLEIDADVLWYWINIKIFDLKFCAFKLLCTSLI